MTDRTTIEREQTTTPLDELMTGDVPQATPSSFGAPAPSGSAFREVERPAPPSSTKVDRIVQIALLANIALIGLILLMPTEPVRVTAIVEPGAAEPDPFVSTQRRINGVPMDQLWQNAVGAAGAGNYEEAVMLLERYLAEARGLSDVERRLIFNQIAYYLVKDGRIAEAQSYERRSDQIMKRSYLAQDLLEHAASAEAAGHLHQMRSAYARFLLQQNQIPPSLRKHVSEAYLKLGDTYRIEAERAEDRELRDELLRRAEEAIGGER